MKKYIAIGSWYAPYQNKRIEGKMSKPLDTKEEALEAYEKYKDNMISWGDYSYKLVEIKEVEIIEEVK